ncbi:uncharacterized protein LOC131634426 [Vicia villosa]|uniref:uncharacterized protein LOC131634426 n=1 Tax=Vicia villosa TaxID=3911 RepID=UPI00273CD1AC|nr:uncharacterized protein LOC131634426 [Vicia villosa]
MKFIFILLSSLLLGCLLLMTVQRNTSTMVISGGESKKNKLEIAEITTILARKEPLERTIGASPMRKLGFGTIMHHEEKSVDSKTIEKGQTSKISGKENGGLKKSFRRLFQLQKSDVHEKHMIMRPKVYLKVTTKVAISRNSLSTNTNTKCSQDCDDAVPIKGSSEKSSRHEQEISKEAQDIDAAKEIESLMYKDYNNKGKPSHRPPINNHEPNNP